MSRIAVLLFLFFLIACATPPPGSVKSSAASSPPPQVAAPIEKKKTPVVPEKGPATPAAAILLRDPASGAVTPLAELAGGQPALLDLSASWCEPCAVLTPRLNGIRSKFEGKIHFFMVIQKGDAPERLPGRPEYPVYQLERAPAELGVTPPQILPTVLIFGADGTVAAAMEGLYPALYYYGVIADVVAGN